MAHNTTSTWTRPQNSWIVWGPVMLGIAVILGESTRTMGAATTDGWLLHIINLFRPQGYSPHVEMLNQALRKSGHFLGYGMLGVILARATFAVVRRHVNARWFDQRFFSWVAGVTAVAAIALCDEFHQSFLPGRGADVHDVLIDTCGAALIGLIYLTAVVSRRRHLIGVRNDQRMRAHFTARLARIAIYRVRQGRSPIRYSPDAA